MKANKCILPLHLGKSMIPAATLIVRISWSPRPAYIHSSRFSSLILHRPPSLLLSRPTMSCCNCFIGSWESSDIFRYREAFGKRMAVAGLKPHHRIALGVSGGPDSMALCVLASDWKVGVLGDAHDDGCFLDGLLAIIVDHGLRAESKDEAKIVSDRVSNMGIRCEIACCNWSDDRPKQGHLQEAARDMRYQIFVDVCIKHQIGALLIAHHADDQAELFILRLSRNSGVLGLAGMAFSSQLFPTLPLSTGESSKIPGIILVRPLLDCSKEDLYKICRAGDQKWVEDPSNKSASFARNRIRMELSKASTEYKTELQALISVCRRIRACIDFACHDLINKAVTITDHGYAIVDLKILDPSNVGDLCLSKFMAAVLQFISQNHRQVRGNASNLLLDYIRMLPCKSSLTVAGCYLCAAPGSKGTKILVCSHSQSDLPLKVEWFPQIAGVRPHEFQHEIEQILAEQKSYGPFLDDSDVCILNLSSSKSILDEAKKLKILSDSTCSGIIEMQMNETARFLIREPLITDMAKKDCAKMVNASQGLLRHGQSCYFMNRFLITWHSSEKSIRDANCCMCAHESDMVANIRLMVDDDWMYLAKLAKDEVPRNYQYQHALIRCDLTHSKEETKLVLDYRSLSAKQALLSLKSIPAAARRSLPVLVNQHQLLLSIPSVGFKQCPCLVVSVVFKPRVPLGGGCSSFL